MPEPELNEADGIKAIIFLQAWAGITETEEQARTGWNGMSDSEKRSTMTMYNMLKPEDAPQGE